MIKAFRLRYAARDLVVVGSVVVLVSLSACGSSSSSSSTASGAAPSTQSSTAAASPTTASTNTGTGTSSSSSSGGGSGGAALSRGAVRGVLHASNHTPTVNKPWSYSVKVTDAAGHPLSGTVDIEFAFDGQVVGHDTPPTHPVTAGGWHGTLTFPPQSIGQPISLQAVVHTSAGSITLDWPVKVHK